MLQDFPVPCQVVHQKFKGVIAYLGTSVFRILGSRFVLVIFTEAHPDHVVLVINVFDIFYSQQFSDPVSGLC